MCIHTYMFVGTCVYIYGCFVYRYVMHIYIHIHTCIYIYTINGEYFSQEMSFGEYLGCSINPNSLFSLFSIVISITVSELTVNIKLLKSIQILLIY